MNIIRHPLKSGPLTLAARPWPPRRPLPAGCDGQGRHPTREFGRAPWHDTVATDYGSADALEPAEACTDVGSDTRPAALSMQRHHRTAGRVALVLLIAPAAAAVLAIVAFAAQHWPG